MNGKENIISKILSDADEKCEKLIESAQKQADELRKETEDGILAESKALESKIAELAKEVLSNRMANAELDARKYVLKRKQELISACYEKAYAKLTKMNAKEKTAFIGGLIANYAENGETVYACKADKDVVTQAFLDGLGKKLVLGKKYLDADGGIVLEGAGYDKDLTLSRVVASVREKTEAAVANALFGE